jgi:N-acetylneuraminic acid mutarotase
LRIKLLYILVFALTLKTYPQNWHVVGSMPNSVFGAQAVVKGSSIYILGGVSESSNSATNKIQEFNPQKNTWDEAAKMNSPRYDFFAGMYSDSIIYFGGVTPKVQNSNALEIWDYTNPPHIYDTNVNFGRLNAAGKIFDNKLYIFGGQPSGLPYLVIYDITKAKITYSSNLSFNLQFPLQQMSTVYGKDIYLFGGTNGVLMNSIYKLSTSDNTFTKLSSELKRPRAGGVAVSTADSSVYIIGGFDETQHALASVEILKLNQDEIEAEDGPELNFPRVDPVVVNYRNSLYVFGGLDKDGQAVNAIERLDMVTGISGNQTVPQNFELENNYPNPFNPSTNITIKVGKTAKVSLDVYNILGQHVKNITSQIYSPGQYSFTWNGTDDAGNSLTSGVYIYKLTSDYYVASKKMILLK